MPANEKATPFPPKIDEMHGRPPEGRRPVQARSELPLALESPAVRLVDG